MRTEKVRFITGAAVGATVNIIIQSAQMAMDYNREFDWNEFFLCAGAGAFAGLGPRLCRRPAAETWNQETPNLQRPDARNLLHLLPDVLEPATSPNHRQFFHNVVAAGLIACAISGKHTLKFSRPTRLFLWAFGMSYLSHIACNSSSAPCAIPRDFRSLRTFSALKFQISNLQFFL
jgi:hypothetical protein